MKFIICRDNGECLPQPVDGDDAKQVLTGFFELAHKPMMSEVVASPDGREAHVKSPKWEWTAKHLED